MRDYAEQQNGLDGNLANLVKLGIELETSVKNRILNNKIPINNSPLKSDHLGQLFYFYPAKKYFVVNFGGREYEVAFKFTKDPFLLSQYYKLREHIACNDVGFEYFDGSENHHDKNGHVFVATIKNKVIAGARLSFSKDGKLLSNEDFGSDYLFKKIASKEGVELEDGKYGEIATLVIDENFRGKTVLTHMFDGMIEFSKSWGIHYLFGSASFTHNRIYRRYFSSIGISSEIVEGFLAPKKAEYNYLEMCPLLIKLN